MGEDVRARVEIRLKKGVTDPEGDNVLKALKLLGFETVNGVRSMKVFEIDVAERSSAKARASIEEMCRKLLANPVVHDYAILIGGSAEPRRPARR